MDHWYSVVTDALTVNSVFSLEPLARPECE